MSICSRGSGSAECAANARTRAGHPLDLGEVGQHAHALLGVGDEIGPKPQARDRRAQIVRDRGGEVLAIGKRALQALLHEIERAGGLAHLARALFRERGGVEVAPEALGRGAEYAIRHGEVAKRPDRGGKDQDDSRRGEEERVQRPPRAAPALPGRRN